jgi:hypothetical protein
MFTKALIFVGGVATGLLLAKLYANNLIQSDVDKGLASIGLGGGAFQSTIDKTIVPILQN